MSSSIRGHRVIPTAVKRPDSSHLLGVQAKCHDCEYRGEIRATTATGTARAGADAHRTETYQAAAVVAGFEALLARQA